MTKEDEDVAFGCVDVLHVGHYYIGIFYAPQTINIDDVLDTMGRLNAALSVLDIKFKKNLSMSLGGVMAASKNSSEES